MALHSDNLLLFLAVLDQGSFSAAARALGRVPSAVSMAVAQMEAELELRLFERSTRELRPTEEARALEPQARQLVARLAQLQAHALALHQGLERRLTLAIAPELLSAAWSEALAQLADEYPALEVDVLSAPQAAVLRMLHAGEIDLALVFERVGFDERESFQELGSERLVAVMAPQHPLAGQRLRQDQWAELRQIAVARRDAGTADDPRVLVSRRLWRTDSHLATLSLVQAGLGWAFLPQRMVDPLLEAGALLQIEFENMSNEVRLWVDVVWRRDRPLGLGARRFIALMRPGYQG
ncbi:LysR family transcriptional regulator [Paucibacter sp. PLA-PC-4]|uniref:LysR family transcriptional regulator n=1 Tax=Paucibacter sp. PLA-PC-4 TaxID=2993655 RepID=UPI00224B34E7|nr:LysR family transcriptional regulator [Paucibacter sp. PLA-PC-4]MCX2863484.1 LysR family transcriptional regulator [Paucibacter sp. PLA-PC-4]